MEMPNAFGVFVKANKEGSLNFRPLACVIGLTLI